MSYTDGITFLFLICEEFVLAVHQHLSFFKEKKLKTKLRVVLSPVSYTIGPQTRYS